MSLMSGHLGLHLLLQTGRGKKDNRKDQKQKYIKKKIHELGDKLNRKKDKLERSRNRSIIITITWDWKEGCNHDIFYLFSFKHINT